MLYENIKKFCRARSVTFYRVEKECGLALGSIYRWDKVTPSVDKVRKVADYLGVTVDELLRTDKNGDRGMEEKR